jgi:hypothetical protein
VRNEPGPGNLRCSTMTDASFKSPLSSLWPDHPSSTAANKSKKKFGDIVKRLLFKRPNPVNDSASQSNFLTQVPGSSPLGGRSPVLGSGVGSIEPTASSKYIDLTSS